MKNSPDAERFELVLGMHALTLYPRLDVLGRKFRNRLIRRTSSLNDSELAHVVECLEFMLDDNAFSAFQNSKGVGVQPFLRHLTMRSLDRLIFLAPLAVKMQETTGFPYKFFVHASLKALLNDLRQTPLRERFWQRSSRYTQQRKDRLNGWLLQVMSMDLVANEELEWFGANWQGVLPHWDILTITGGFHRDLVEMLMAEKKTSPTNRERTS